MVEDIRWEQRFMNFKKALARLQMVQASDLASLSDLEKRDLYSGSNIHTNYLGKHCKISFVTKVIQTLPAPMLRYHWHCKTVTSRMPTGGVR